MYRQNRQRDELRQQSKTFEDFLNSLELKVHIAQMQDGQQERVAQLTQRTNQFNNTTIRLKVEEVEALSSTPDMEIVTVTVSDRFGEYGLVGVIICRQTAEYLNVESFMLSCRVLGKRVEHRILRYLGEKARASGLEYVRVPYKKSERNQPIFNFLESVKQYSETLTPETEVYIFGVESLLNLSYPVKEVPHHEN
jgi:FkbH-like protein